MHWPNQKARSGAAPWPSQVALAFRFKNPVSSRAFRKPYPEGTATLLGSLGASPAVSLRQPRPWPHVSPIQVGASGLPCLTFLPPQPPNAITLPRALGMTSLPQDIDRLEAPPDISRYITPGAPAPRRTNAPHAMSPCAALRCQSRLAGRPSSIRGTSPVPRTSATVRRQRVHLLTSNDLFWSQLNLVLFCWLGRQPCRRRLREPSGRLFTSNCGQFSHAGRSH